MDDNPWYAPVGKFMLAFGGIEHSTIALLGCLPDCKIPKNAPKLPLVARIDLLREILPRYFAPEYKAVLACLEEVTRQSTFRNLVAHNSIWFDIYKDGDRIMITNHLVSARDRKKALAGRDAGSGQNGSQPSRQAQQRSPRSDGKLRR